jgi:hypothetical protein
MYSEVNDTNEKQQIIRKMSKIKDYLENTPAEYKNDSFKKIEESVTQYIHDYCMHSIVCDTVDYAYERSKVIYYCEICETDFTDNL